MFFVRANNYFLTPDIISLPSNLLLHLINNIYWVGSYTTKLPALMIKNASKSPISMRKTNFSQKILLLLSAKMQGYVMC